MPKSQKRTGRSRENQSPAKKRRQTSATARVNRQEQQKKTKRRNREIVGVILIALGIFTFLMLTDMTGYIGEVLSSFFYGLFGVVLGAIPVILVVCGIYTIIFADRDFQAINGLLLIGIILCVLSIVHIAMLSKSTITSVRPSYINYITNAFLLGETTHIGGGLFGSLISYFVYYFLGKVTSYLFFATCIIIMSIVITNLSLRDAGEKITQFFSDRWDQWQGKTEEERAERARERAIRHEERKQEKIALRQEKRMQRRAEKEEKRAQQELEREARHIAMEKEREKRSMYSEELEESMVEPQIHRQREYIQESNSDEQKAVYNDRKIDHNRNQEVVEEVDFDELTLGDDAEREQVKKKWDQNQKPKASHHPKEQSLFDEPYDRVREKPQRDAQAYSIEVELDHEETPNYHSKNTHTSRKNTTIPSSYREEETKRSSPSLPKRSQSNEGPDLYPARGTIPRKQSNRNDDLDVMDLQANDRSASNQSQKLNNEQKEPPKYRDDLFVDYIQKKPKAKKPENQYYQPKTTRPIPSERISRDRFQYEEPEDLQEEIIETKLNNNEDVYHQDFGEYEPYLPPIPQRWQAEEEQELEDELLDEYDDHFDLAEEQTPWLDNELVLEEPDFTARNKTNQNQTASKAQYIEEDYQAETTKQEPIEKPPYIPQNKSFVRPAVHQQPINDQYASYDDIEDQEDEYDELLEEEAYFEKPNSSSAVIASSAIEDNEWEVLDEYAPPPLELLDYAPMKKQPLEDLQEKSELLEMTLQDFGIKAKVVDQTCGPVITRFELQPAPGVRVSRITNLSDDIALALAAPRVRIEAPIPGKAAVGIEIPNKVTSAVALRDLLESPEFDDHPSSIAVALGRDIAGKVVVADITKMPHLLIAGSTGSGKSVCINTIICSFLYHSSPDDVKLIMVDPKVVELASFSKIPHLLIPVVTDPDRAASALQWGVKEMVRRYNAFAEKGARDLGRYNELLEREGQKKEPKIVIIVDELADLMMAAPSDVEEAICRIAQMGRAAGIHLIIATQRPSADIITGLIKANVPSRIAFAVASATDSRIILDTSGADKLLGRGDMLFNPIGASQPTRVQGALVTDEEIERLRCYFEETGLTAEFDEATQDEIGASSMSASMSSGGGNTEGDFDPLLPEIVEMFMAQGQASLSMIQRRMRVGYAKAGRLIDELEQMGIVSASEGSKPRKILISRAEFEQIFGFPPNVSDVGTT